MKVAAASGALVVGGTAFTGQAGAHLDENVNVEVESTINRGQRGVVPVTVTSAVASTTISDLLDDQEVDVEDLRFGPRQSGVPENGTSPRSYTMSADGEELRVRFESGAGEDNNWWDDEDYADRDEAVVASHQRGGHHPWHPLVFGVDDDIKVVGGDSSGGHDNAHDSGEGKKKGHGKHH